MRILHIPPTLKTTPWNVYKFRVHKVFVPVSNSTSWNVYKFRVHKVLVSVSNSASWWSVHGGKLPAQTSF